MKKSLGVAAATIALAFVVAAYTPAQSVERAGAYAGDAAITAEVERALWQDPALRVMRIEVSTYQNVVQLSGSVDRSQMIGLAGRVANDVSGVASVQNALVVN